MGKCKWCNGRGWDSAEGGRYFSCPDCDGTGNTPECDVCGAEYDGEYCDKCYDVCENCGERTQKEELNNGLCEYCAAVK